MNNNYYNDCWTYPKEKIDEMFRDIKIPQPEPPAPSDPGYTVTETPLFSETVTTVSGEMGNSAELTYSGQITADKIKVVFDGVSYICPAIVFTNQYVYGGVGSDDYDFTEYPFCIVSTAMGNTIITETEGTYTVSVSALSIEVSDNFSEAVGKCMVVPVFTFDESTETYSCNKSFNEIYDAIVCGKCFVAHNDNRVFVLKEFYGNSIIFSNIDVSGEKVTDIQISMFDDGTIEEVTWSYPSN